MSTPAVAATGLQSPWSIAFLERTPIISERDTARILELLPGGELREIGVVEGVVHGGEGGLLGLAVDDERRLYAYSTGPNGNRIDRFAIEGAPGALALGARETILDGVPSGRIHNGGRIRFGPDGMLYVGTGDASERGLAQDPGSLGGKILRMTPDGQAPPDNPFPGSLVYSLGHRNVQGLAWAPDGTLLATEFGQDTWDELNVIVAGGNYGWPVVEGVAGDPAFVDPVQQWAPVDASPSGLAIAGGAAFVANLRGASLRVVPLDDLAASELRHLGEFGRVRDAVVGPDGSIWVLTSNTDGRGEPGPDDDRLVLIPPGAGGG